MTLRTGRTLAAVAGAHRPEAEKAAQHVLSDTCFEDVNKEIGPVERNDTVIGFGCSTSGGGIGAAGGVLGALGLALAAARRRRRSC